MDFHPVSHTIIPRDDGAHANDWVTEQFDLLRVQPIGVDWPQGPRRGLLVELRVEVYDGSGSNTWTVTPVYVANPETRSDDRTWMEDTRACAVGINPRSFTQADLPLQRTYHVGLRKGAYALQLARTGAGTNRLRVRLFAIGGYSR